MAVGRCRRNSFAIDLLNCTLLVECAFHSEAAAEQIFDGPVAVPDRRQSSASQIDVLKIVGTRLGIDSSAGRLWPASVNVFEATILIGVAQQRAAILGRTVERQPLGVGPGSVIG